MYATLDIIKNSKHSGKIIGVHQKIDGIARQMLNTYLKHPYDFPSKKQILYFEGTRGPDGLKRKSPADDEPHSFLNPEKDDGKLFNQITNHHYNLSVALEERDVERASFEAAWLAHFIVDGLTPAHHYPFDKIVNELMSEQDYHELFGMKLKGIMRGDSFSQTIINNWSYIGAGGTMTKHIAYELGVAYFISPVPTKKLLPKVKLKAIDDLDYQKIFYDALHGIYKKDYYHYFLQEGWDNKLIKETLHYLVPTIIQTVLLIWLSATPQKSIKEKYVKNKTD